MSETMIAEAGDSEVAALASEFSIIDITKLQKTPVMEYPYPFQLTENLIAPEHLGAILTSFPSIEQGGSFPLDEFELTGSFKQLVEELHSSAFRQQIETLFEISLADRSTMTTLRGISRDKDGRIHTDSKSKLITVLIYLNEDRQEQDAGCLRILNQGHNMEDYSEKVQPAAGTCLIFKVTNNCWHGYPKFVGRRQSLQFNYVINEEAANSHLSRHKLSAKLKKWFKKS